jgi:hypothetical protein
VKTRLLTVLISALVGPIVSSAQTYQPTPPIITPAGFWLFCETGQVQNPQFCNPLFYGDRSYMLAFGGVGEGIVRVKYSVTATVVATGERKIFSGEVACVAGAESFQQCPPVVFSFGGQAVNFDIFLEKYPKVEGQHYFQ